MHIVKMLVAAATIALSLASCASRPKEVPELPVAVLYDNAQIKLQQGDFRDAIAQLEELDNRYPYGAHAQQVQLDLIYAYHKVSEWALTQTMTERFMRLNTAHPDTDYVLYLSGLTSLSLDDNAPQRWCGIDQSDRDNTLARQAFRDFRELVTHYPNSPYAVSAWARLICLKNHFSKYELAVATHYYQREAYVAAVNRLVQLLQDYPDTRAARQALPLLKSAYQQLKMAQAAAKVEQLIRANAMP